MNTAGRYAGQVFAYAVFAALLGFFATEPAYNPVEPGMAMIKLSFTHVGQQRGECRRLSPEELAQLPPNMRRPLDCPRERLPVTVELDLDGRPLLHREIPASGWSRDRASSVYFKYTVPPGRHRLAARLRDSARTAGFDHVREADIELEPGQNLVVDFRAEAGGFLFR